MRTSFDRVVVIGGSIAGLLAARVLAEHAREVVLIERDRIGDHPCGVRKGVPQAHHAHAMLTSGQRAIESLCPGWTESLLERGAQFGGGTFYTAGGYLHTPSHDPSLYASRPLLEAQLRRSVLAHSGLTLLDGWQADVPQLERGRVVGVRASPLDGDAPRELAADLVVDASGRASRTAAWLASVGYPAPHIERVEVGMRYASRLVRRAETDFGGRLFFSVSPSAACPRACGILAQEDGAWIVTLIGYFGDQPPLDDDGFLAFARSLPAPEPVDLLQRAEPLGPIRPFAFAANQRSRYERMSARPPGLLAIGDALASFSPVYGQGMSVAALQAQTLRACLAQGPAATLEAYYFRAVSRVIDTPWTITVGNDRQLAPGGPHGTWVQRARHRWLQRVLRAGHRDRVVASAFVRVARLVATPATLLRPDIALRVLLHSRSFHQPAIDAPRSSAVAAGEGPAHG
jgi:2-polyprenyl-6-methoxyphenol hydroxylase-like FAD-dependent oxidoreductase